MNSLPQPSGPLRLAVIGFEVDRVTAEVTTALAAAGVASVLIKGPAIATWIYRGDGSRLYGDTDLLVRSADWARAASVLEDLGFEDDLGPLAHPRMESTTGYPWVRAGDGACVDMHCTLFGVGADPEAVWAAFSEGATSQPIGGADVSLPPFPARLLHIALHAVQHGGEALPKPMIDLERALAQVAEDTWRQAWELATVLRAEEAFAAGLALTPAGRRLALAIGAEPSASGSAALRLARVPLAEGFAELSRAPGARAKLALAVRELFPNRAFIEWWSPLARRGPLGRVAAYAWRWGWLARRAVPGYRAWRANRP